MGEIIDDIKNFQVFFFLKKKYLINNPFLVISIK